MPANRRRTTRCAVLVVATLTICLETISIGSRLLPASNTWLAAPSMGEARAGAASALLKDGRVLITGGEGAAGILSSSEVYDRTANSFRPAASLTHPRSGHVAVLLNDGRVLVAGGDVPGDGPTHSTEIYDPAADAWSPAGELLDARKGATASLLNDGRVLIAGGTGKDGVLASLEVFDPATGAFTYAGLIVPARKDHAAAVLHDGRVLIIGGTDGVDALTSVEIYDPRSGSVSPAPGLLSGRAGHSATTLLDGTVLVAGGNDGHADLSSAEVFDPVNGIFAAVAQPMQVPRRDHAAFLLPDNNNVLIVGGTSGGAAQASAELYVPWTGTFRSTGWLAQARTNAVGNSLAPDGMLLLAGGRDASNRLASAEMYGFATVRTDWDDYFPGEPVEISGSGWKPGETVRLQLHEHVDPAIHDDDVLEVVADANGDIFDDSFAPDQHDLGIRFYLTATGAASQAQITFTDSAPATIVIQKLTNPEDATDKFNFTGEVGGTVFSGGTITVTNLRAGTYTSVETAKAGWALTNITCDDTDSTGDVSTRTATFRVDAGEIATCTFTNTQGGSIVVDKVTSPSGDPQSFGFTTSGAGYAGFSLADATPPNVQTLLPGTYAVNETVPAGWDLSSAVCTSSLGGTKPNTAIALTGGETVTCVFTDTKRAHLVVDKVTSPAGDPQSFSFVATGGAYTGFSLTDIAPPNDQTLTPGTYSVAENVPAGWDLSSSVCTSSLGGTQPSSSVTLVAGETVTCVFTDTKRGHLIVDKVTNPAADPTSFAFHATGGLYTDFSLTDVAPPNDQTLVPGAYTIAETVPAGWDLTSAVCTSSVGGTKPNTAIVLTAGETISCVFTDTKRGNITVDKVTNPAADPTSFAFHATGGLYTDFSLTDAAPPNNQSLAPGTYTIAETVPAGWDLTSAVCTSSLGGTKPSSGIALTAGETVNCVFTDTKRGHLVVDKVTDPIGDPQSFNFHGAGGLYADFSLTDAAPPNDQALAPGTYSVTEIVPAGWNLTGVVCTSSLGGTKSNTAVVLAAGETVTCVFTDTKRGHLVVDKVTIPGSDPQSFSFLATGATYANFSLTDAAPPNDQTLVSGTYGVSETVPSGWDLSSVVCTSSLGGTKPNTAIALAAGETVTCVFTDTKRGHILVDKITDPTGDPQSFNFVATGGAYAGFSLTDAAPPNDQALAPGTYGIAETVPMGWALGSAVCTSSFGGTKPAASFALGAGETVSCVFTNQKDAFILVQKQTAPHGDPATFGFTSTFGSPFALSDGQQHSSGDIDPGTYSVAESVPAGWDLTSAVCTSSLGGSELNTAIVLTAGETVTCVFTDTKRGHIVVDKVTNPLGDPTNFSFIATGGTYAGFSLSDTAPPNDQALQPGTYGITETVPASWKLTSAVCTSSVGGTKPNTAIVLTAGETVTCVFTDTKRGTIIVEKQTNPDLAPGDFTFTGDAAGVVSDNGTITVTNLVPGAYTSTEASAAPVFDLTSIVCSDGNSTGDVASRTATFNVEAGETVTCVFTNTKRGHLVVDKVTNPGGDPTGFNFVAAGGAYTNFSLTDAAPPNDQVLAPGTYSVAETVPAGWDLASAVCTSSLGGTKPNTAIALTAAETVTCVFTDTKRGHIIVDKVTNPTGDPATFDFLATGGSYTGFTLSDATAPNDQALAPGTYSVAETVPAGWDLSSAVCTSSIGGTKPNTAITLTPAETVTCVFTDTKRGHVVVDKVTNPTGDPQSFNFVASGGLYTNFSLTDAAAPNDQTLAPGLYSVLETVPAGWDLTSAVCTSSLGGTKPIGGISLSPGETVSCVVTNTKRGHLIVDKVTNPSGDPTSFAFHATGGTYSDFTLTDAALPNNQTLVPGTYGVSETVPAGWDLSSAVCTSSLGGTKPNAAIPLTAGETVTCVFTDTKRGHIVVDKITNPAGDPQSFNFVTTGGLYANFSLTDAATPNDQPLAPGTYSVAETVPTGWDLTNTVCTSSLGGTKPSTEIVLAANESVTCVFTDTKRAHIVVDKVTVPSGDPTSFAFVAGGGAYASFNLTDAAAPNDQALVPGTYSVAETVPPTGWDLTSVSCTSSLGGTKPNAAVVLAAGETVTCVFTDTKRGTIVVEKETNPDLAPGSFSFSGDAGGIITDNGTITVTNLVPGVYTSTEASAAPAFDLTSIACSDGNSTGDIGARTATFHVEAGEVVTCVFTNTQRGHLVVDKVTNPAGDPQSFSFVAGGGLYAAFSLTDAAPPNDQALAPGTYSIAENVPAGWDLTSAVCTSSVGGTKPSAAIALASGETVTCVFTDTKRAHLIVDKVTDPSGDPQSFGFHATGGSYVDFTLTDAAPANDQILVSGTYTVSETVPAGWDLTSAVCTSSLGGTKPSSGIVLAAGETVTCVFTDTKRGHLVVDKVTNPGGDPQSFGFHATGGAYADFSLTDTAVPNDQLVVPGTYGVAETVPAGWDLTSAVCSSSLGGTELNGAIVLTAGETVTCVFTDTKRGTIVVEKETNPDGAVGNFTFTGDVVGTIADNGTITVGNLIPGIYSSSETNPAPVFDLSNIVCSDGNSTVDIATRTATFHLDAGETITCVFTNTKRGHLVVDKVTNPSGDPQSFAFVATGGSYASFALTDVAAPSDQALTPGTYAIAETVPAGWDLSSAVCTSSLGGTKPNTAIALAAGETVTCVFTDTKRAHLIVDKITIPGGDTQSFGFHATGALYADFSLTDAAPPNDQTLVAGTYGVTETVPAGWNLTSAVCTSSLGGTKANTSIALAAGETVTCVFTDTKRGTIIVQKQTAPDLAAGDFTFTGDAAGVISDNGTITVTNLIPGTYTSTEASAAPAFDLASIACSDGNSTGDVGARTATFRVEAGETVTCVFTNTQRGHILVDKVTNPAGDPTGFSFVATGGAYGGFSLTDAAPPNDQALAPGAYSIAETVPAGWDLSSAVCTSSLGGTKPNAALTLTAGETIICVFTDTKRGHVVVDKVTIPGGDPQSFSFVASGGSYTSFSLTDAAAPNDQSLAPGTYSVAETVPAGWNLTSAVCTSSFGGTEPNSGIVLSAGEIVSCVFTDTKIGHIVVDKVTNPGGDPQSFSFVATGGAYSGFSLTDAAAPNDQALSAGTYSIAETVPADWSLTSAICTSSLGGTKPNTGIVLTAGETVSCVFTDTKRGTIIVEKETNPDSAPGNFTFTGDAAGVIADNGTITVTNLVPGIYTSSETNPAPGFDVSSIVCSDGNSTADVGARTATFHLEAGETVTCVFTNTARGHLIVDKVTAPAADPQNFSFVAAGGTYAGFSLNDAAAPNDQALAPGTYSISETVPTGWDLTSVVCTSSLGGTKVNTAIALTPNETVTCVFTDTKRGHVVVDKVTNPSGDPQSFAFVATGGAYAGFSLTDAAAPNDQALVAGTYGVTETVPSGWNLTSAVCTSSLGGTKPNTAFTLAAGEIVTCVFTDTKRGVIIVEKQTNPDGAPGDFTFTGDAAGTVSDNGTITVTNLFPGTYTSTEVNPSPAFELASIVCSDTNSTGDVGGRTATFRVEAGETVTCVFTNTQRGHLIVDKVTTPSGDPQVFGFVGSGGAYGGFSLTDAAPPNDQALAPGTYAVTETVPAGWDLTSAICTSSLGGTKPNTAIALVGGETVTCVFTDRKRGHLVVDKVTNPTGDPQSFAFVASGGAYAGFSLTDAAPPNDQMLAPGTYAVAETAVAGWTQTSAVCSNGSPVSAIAVGAGEVVTCTFTNTKVPTNAHIVIVKQTDPAGSTTDFSFLASYLPTPADPSFRAQTTKTDHTSTAIFKKPTGTATGDVLVVFMTWNNSANLVTPPAGWMQIGSSLVAGTIEFQAWYHVVTAAESGVTQWNWGLSTSIGWYTMGGAYRNGNPAAPLDGFSTATKNTGNTIVAPSIPLATARDLLVLFDDVLGDGTWTLPSGFTKRVEVDNQTIGDKLFAAAGASGTQTSTLSLSGTSKASWLVALHRNGNFTLRDGQVNDSGTLSPGTYSVSEIVPDGWTLMNATCSDGSPITAISLQAGETVTCTFVDKKN